MNVTAGMDRNLAPGSRWVGREALASCWCEKLPALAWSGKLLFAR